MCGRLVNLDTVARVLAEYYHLKTDTQLAALDEALSKVPAVSVGGGHEKDHVADPGKMVGDSISRAAAIEAIKEDKIDLTDPNVVAVFKATGDFEKVETQVMTCDRHIKILKDLPSAQPVAKDTNVPVKDCISRRAAVDALGERPVVWSDNDDYTLGARNQYDMDRLAIETVPSAQRWISCSECLPEPGVYVLVDGADIPGGDRFPLIDKICDDGEWLNCDGSEWSAVAWMSIPEPWKGERDG